MSLSSSQQMYQPGATSQVWAQCGSGGNTLLSSGASGNLQNIGITSNGAMSSRPPSSRPSSPMPQSHTRAPLSPLPPGRVKSQIAAGCPLSAKQCGSPGVPGRRLSHVHANACMRSTPCLYTSQAVLQAGNSVGSQAGMSASSQMEVAPSGLCLRVPNFSGSVHSTSSVPPSSASTEYGASLMSEAAPGGRRDASNEQANSSPPFASITPCRRSEVNMRAVPTGWPSCSMPISCTPPRPNLGIVPQSTGSSPPRSLERGCNGREHPLIASATAVAREDAVSRSDMNYLPHTTSKDIPNQTSTMPPMSRMSLGTACTRPAPSTPPTPHAPLFSAPGSSMSQQITTTAPRSPTPAERPPPQLSPVRGQCTMRSPSPATWQRGTPEAPMTPSTAARQSMGLAPSNDTCTGSTTWRQSSGSAVALHQGGSVQLTSSSTLQMPTTKSCLVSSTPLSSSRSAVAMSPGVKVLPPHLPPATQQTIADRTSRPSTVRAALASIDSSTSARTPPLMPPSVQPGTPGVERSIAFLAAKKANAELLTAAIANVELLGRAVAEAEAAAKEASVQQDKLSARTTIIGSPKPMALTHGSSAPAPNDLKPGNAQEDELLQCSSAQPCIISSTTPHRSQVKDADTDLWSFSKGLTPKSVELLSRVNAERARILSLVEGPSIVPGAGENNGLAAVSQTQPNGMLSSSPAHRNLALEAGFTPYNDSDECSKLRIQLLHSELHVEEQRKAWEAERTRLLERLQVAEDKSKVDPLQDCYDHIVPVDVEPRHPQNIQLESLHAKCLQSTDGECVPLDNLPTFGAREMSNGGGGDEAAGEREVSCNAPEFEQLKRNIRSAMEAMVRLESHKDLSAAARELGNGSGAPLLAASNGHDALPPTPELGVMTPSAQVEADRRDAEAGLVVAKQLQDAMMNKLNNSTSQWPQQHISNGSQVFHALHSFGENNVSPLQRLVSAKDKSASGQGIQQTSSEQPLHGVEAELEDSRRLVKDELEKLREWYRTLK